MEKQLKYNEPWILQRADPYVYRHTDGTYYFTASVPEYDRIVLRSASHLADLADAEEHEVWHKHESGPQSIHIWAPELHYLFGKWYLYYAGAQIWMTSGRSARMCWSVREMTRFMIRGWKKAR